ncbi:putative dinucleotide-utilizing enzyme [Bradyrhizobium sp. LM2.7]
MPTVSVLLKCAAAVVDRKFALEQLARRLENMVFMVSAASLPEVVDTLRVLQSINQELAPMLGRAIALGRIGAPRGGVAQVLAPPA